MRYIIILLFLVAACEKPAQSITFETLEGAWLAGGLQMDENIYRPISQFMVIDSNSQILRLSGNWRDSLQDLTVKSDSIIFPYRTVPISSLRYESGELSIGKYYPVRYKKVEPRIIAIDSVDLKKNFFLGQWISDERILDFRTEEVMIVDLASKEKTKRCWDIYNLDGFKFLQLKGNFNRCDFPFDALGLLHSVEKDTIVIEQWIDGQFKKLTYKKTTINIDDYEFPEFRLCNPYLYENSGSDWYHFKYTSYEGGLYRLKQLFDDQFKSVEEGVNNGIIKVSFVVNCVGEIGRISSKEMNNEYEVIRMNPKVLSQITEILQGGGNWIPGDRRNEKVDTYKFLMFKVKDGKIDEIFP